jgi:hypothetical protein
MLAASGAIAANRLSPDSRLLMTLNGRATYLGRISATTSAKNNADTTAFDIPTGTKVLMVCTSNHVRVLADTNVTEDITIANGVLVLANTCTKMILLTTDVYLQAITNYGSADVDVWKLE